MSSIGRTIIDNGIVRQFPTGATRDTSEGKLEFDGFLNPLVLVRFAEYMHENRKLPDGTLRASDNWTKGIPRAAYLSSMVRHLVDLWLHHRGHPEKAREDIETALCALLFNVQGYLHEVLLGRDVGRVNAHEENTAC